MAWLTGWSNRKKLTVDHTQVDGALSDFPVYVHLDGDTDVAATALANGHDLRITSSDGETTLSYEREYWDITGGSCTAHVWFKAPSISAVADTEFYLYYGKADAADGEDANNVWDGDFVLVHHYAGASPFADSSGEGNSGADTGTAQDDGQVYKCRDFDGAGDKITVADADELDGMDDLTLEAWVYADTYGHGTDYGRILAKGDGNPYVLLVNNYGANQRVQFQLNAADLFSLNNAFSTGAWHHIAGVWQRNTAGGHGIYVDGSLSNSQNAADSAVNASADDVVIGNRAAADRTFDGRIDEVRISTCARAAAWLAAEHCNVATPTTFYGLASEESAAGGATRRVGGLIGGPIGFPFQR